jgi:hypothetical protein
MGLRGTSCPWWFTGSAAYIVKLSLPAAPPNDDAGPGKGRPPVRKCNQVSKHPERLAQRFASSDPWRLYGMCRNIKTLFNFDPPVTAEEVRAASLQFVRKISGFNKPSKANEAAFLAAVDEIAAVSARLLHALDTSAPPKNREEEAAKAKARAAERFGA